MRHKPSIWHSTIAVLKKDGLSETRSPYALSSLLAFAVTSLAALSMSIGGLPLSPRLGASLLWVILFFAAMAGLARGFAQEQDAGTLLTLRVYALPQAVFFGKLILNILLLIVISFVLLPLFLIFFDMTIPLQHWPPLGGTLFLGLIGMAAISTLTAAMAAQAQGRSALFTILTFPLLLPEFLAAIQLTGAIFLGDSFSYRQMLFLGAYDIVAIVAGSILFDYLWTD